jgi:tripartite-type tricarboxylate transporter receptor subunit TctC
MASLRRRDSKMSMFNRREMLAWAAGLMGIPALASAYPDRPIRLVVGFPPGGFTDVSARLFADQFRVLSGQSLVIENQSGAASTIAAGSVAKSPSDGYTLLWGHTNSHTIAPAITRRLSYDAQRDFVPVSLIGFTPFVLVINPNRVAATSVQELIALAKASPGQLLCASAGTGSNQHLALEALSEAAGVSFNHIPYKGSGPVAVDLIGGAVDLSIDGLTSTLPHIASGRMKALAVFSRSRVPQLPDVPTMAEAGVPGLELSSSWVGVLAPAGTPMPIVDWLNETLTRISKADGMASRFEAAGGLLGETMTPTQFGRFLETEVTRVRTLVKTRNIALEMN